MCLVTVNKKSKKFFILFGIKDKNKKEIYVGDIIRYKNSIEEGIGVIEECKGGFVIVWTEIKKGTPAILTHYVLSLL